MAERGPVDIAVVGLVGGQCFGSDARAAIDGAEVVVGSPRQLALAQPRTNAEQVVIAGGLDPILDAIDDRWRRGARVCVLASGDPGFFGIVRILSARFGAGALAVHPAPSSVSLAFARIGTTWDDALIVSAHGRSLADAVDQALDAPKVAVLTSPDNPPEKVGAALLAAGCGARDVSVLTRIGEESEAHFDGSLDDLASGTFDPMSIVVLRDPTATSDASLAWGLPEDAFLHRDGMITKAEVRAVALGKLALPRTGVCWDVGAGSGSVAIEAARLSPRLRVIAVEADAESAARIRQNASTHSVGVEVVHGHAPDALAPLPDPDRVFVGGGGLDVLDAALARLRPGGVIVASYALVGRAAAAWERLGNLVQLSVARGVPTGEVGVRLASENPVFVCWGPASESTGSETGAP